MRKAMLIALRLMVLVATSAALTVSAGVAWAEPPPPPITTPPPATTAPPPAEAIVDTVDPIEPCSDWFLQSAYGDEWPTNSTWWAYTCRFEGISNPEDDRRTDYYYWDSAQAASVYYGQRLVWSLGQMGDDYCLSWYDQATSQWYGPWWCAMSTTPPTARFTVSCFALSCSFDASASSDSDGTIQGYRWDFGDGAIFASDTSIAAHTYAAAGSYPVNLTITDNNNATDTLTEAITVTAPPNTPPTAAFTRTCSGLSCSFNATGSADSDGTITTYAWTFGDSSTGSGATVQHTYTQPGSYPVTLTVTDNAGATGTNTQTATAVAPPNTAPTAAFTLICSGLSCSFNAAGSADSDGTITTYAWTFGNGSTGSGVTTQHAYSNVGSYPVTLTVTDNAGATATTTKAVPLLGLAARGYKVKGAAKVDLTWTGSGSASVNVYRNGTGIATAAGSTYTDTISKPSAGRYTYRVCYATLAICSNEAAVTF